MSRALAVMIGLGLLAALAMGRAEAPGLVWEEKAEVASGGGYQGPWRMNESVYDYVDDPSVAMDETGAVALVWVDQVRKDVLFQLYGPDGAARLAAPVNVSRSPRVLSWLPRMALGPDGAGEIFVLWQEIVFSGGSHGGEIFFARSTDGGASFDAPLNLSKSLAGDGKGRLTPKVWHNGSLDIAAGPEGDLYVAWSDYDGDLWFSRSSDRGASFPAPSLVTAGRTGKPARGPALAVGPAGAVHLAWTVGEDRAADIHLASSRDYGRSFDEARIVHESGGHSDAPKIALDGDGTLHLVYAESPSGPFRQYHVRYTRRPAGEPDFEPPRMISGAHTQQVQRMAYPGLGLDGAGRVFVVWESYPGRVGFPRGLGFTHSDDGGRNFAPPAMVPGSTDPALGDNGSRQGLLMRKLAVDRTGRLALVNSSFKKGVESRVWLYRGRAAGGPGDD